MRIMFWLFGIEIVDFRIAPWSEGKSTEPEEMEFGFVSAERTEE